MKCFEIPLSPLFKVSRMNKQRLVPEGKHISRVINEYILYIIKSGELRVRQDGKVLTLFPGDVYIFNLGELQQPCDNVSCEFYYIHFHTLGVNEMEMSDIEYSDSIWRRRSDFSKENIYGYDCYDHIKVLLKQRMHFDDMSTIDSFLKMIDANRIDYRGYNTPEWRMNVSNVAARLLMRIEDKCFERDNKEIFAKGSRVYDNVRMIIEYIEKHYKENFDSSIIEKELLINFDYANRIFKKHFGYSIIRYRNKLRINTAKILLGEKSMQEIARGLGFNDVYYFSRCFKRYEGVSPDEYKRYVLGLRKADDIIEN